MIALPETMVIENDMAVVATIGSIAQMTSCGWTISMATKMYDVFFDSLHIITCAAQQHKALEYTKISQYLVNQRRYKLEI